MRKFWLLLAVAIPVCLLFAAPVNAAEVGGMQIKVGDKSYNVVLENNETAMALAEMMPLKVEMTELNGNEKYYYLDRALPGKNENISQINAGDIMLFSGRYLVLFYKTFRTSYSYVRLGRIENPSGLAETLGNSDIIVSFEK